ncbi:MAG TPA: tetratricopeptide repeat protein [Longimicrobiales bacterium]|nr:tetratricopeptide repeat protein [Longimicrobiales bacterium]
MSIRHPTARRVHRPDAPDDVFVAGVLESTAWAKQHQRALIIGGIIATVVIVSLVLFVRNRAERRAGAEVQLNQVRAVAMSGNAPLAIRELEQFLTRYDGTPASAEARLLLARAYLDTGELQQAIETAQPIARDTDSDLGVNAAFLQAAAHEAAGANDLAERAYLSVADDARFLFQRQEALENAARLRLQSNDAAGALELYERLIDMTPQNAPERTVFEMRAGEARVAAERSGG